VDNSWLPKILDEMVEDENLDEETFLKDLKKNSLTF